MALLEKCIIVYLIASSLFHMIHSRHWTYDVSTAACGSEQEPCSPTYWSRVSPGCSSDAQSPINIDASIVSIDDSFQGPIISSSSVGCSHWMQQVYESSTFQLSYAEVGCGEYTVSYGEKSFVLQTISFHSPSEHTVGGGYFAAEVQFEHRGTGVNNHQILVMSVFLTESVVDIPGSDNEFLKMIWEEGGETAGELNNEQLISVSNPMNPYEWFTPGKQAQYYYEGSLTTPNCTGGVSYFIFESPVVVSSYDLDLLRSIASNITVNKLDSEGNNNRPVQPLNGRKVLYIPGGLVPTASPTTSPTTKPTHSPTTLTVLPQKNRRWPKPLTALVIGSAALAVSVCMLVVVGIVLYEIIVSYGYSKKIWQYFFGEFSDGDKEYSKASTDSDEEDEEIEMVGVSADGLSEKDSESVEFPPKVVEIRHSPYLFPENANIDARSMQSSILSSFLQGDIFIAFYNRAKLASENRPKQKFTMSVDSGALEN